MSQNLFSYHGSVPLYAPHSTSDRTSSAAFLSTNARKLASAAPAPSLFDSNDGYASLDYASQRGSPSQAYQLPRLAPDLSNILMIDQTVAVDHEAVGMVKKHSYIRGNVWEVEATLDACLQIHRWDRALSILRQLHAMHQGNEPELQRLYNKVLEAMVFDHIYNRSSENITRINGWVEGEMTKAGVAPNAQTFALKIKAAMATLSGSRRDRTVRRYWAMAKTHGVNWEVASLREILSDNDLGKLSEIELLKGEFEKYEDLDDAEIEDLDVREGVVSRRALPRINETSQKGLGMYSLKKSLSLFDDPSQLSEWESAKTADQETLDAHARQRQIRLEQDALSSASERWRTEHEKMAKRGVAGKLETGKIGALMWTWHQGLLDKIKGELEKISEAEAKTKKTDEDKLRAEYGPFMRLLDPETLAALTLTTTVTVLVKQGIDKDVKLVRLVIAVGRMVEAEVQARMEKQRETLGNMMRQKAHSTANPSNANRLKEQLEELNSRSSSLVQWSTSQCTKLGSVLCEMFLDSAKIGGTREATSVTPKTTFQEPAFDRRIVFSEGRRVGVVSVHSDVQALLTNEPVADVIAKQLPMICKPAPWSGYADGGYLQSRLPMIRVKNADPAQLAYTKAAAKRGDLDEIYAGLDVLGQTGWRINQDVFRVMVDAWNSGEAIANLPPVGKVFPELEKPAEDASLKEKYDYYKQIRAINNEKGGIHSNRCFQNFQMEIARSFYDETFYLPHNVDFRGRAYPIPPYLNQMGADNARGLMLFDKGRELGEKGLMWLKIHLSNVCGYDKASLTDRAQYADDHIEDIRDSVQNPLDGKRWWLNAEDPWQCLATCHELIKAIDSGNPLTYVSHLPIHQDGTCNGLQHYAALGGDIAGARQVNLEPGDRPADVYTGVAEMVKADIKQDAQAGDELAKEMDGRITRKIVKQTVMTNVYGVTFRGATQQVKKQLNDLHPDLNERVIPAASYVARKIFKGLGKLFEGAHSIQYWFGDCANRITSSISPAQLEQLFAAQTDQQNGKRDKRIKRDGGLAERKALEQTDFRSTVVWTTPLGLPVVQPYRIQKSQSVKTHMATIVLADPHVTDSVDKRRQLQAFPPNFIHSLDATHMLLSAVKCREQGLTFSAVHDSFWTHAADIDSLNLILRDAFIRMHTEDIVGRLAMEFETRYKSHLYLAKVHGNSTLAKDILKWRATTTKDVPNLKKGHKQHQYYELVQEYKRQQLLASEDPAERVKGEKMVTPASLFEEQNGEKFLRGKNSLGETALGSVPQGEPDTSVVEEALQHDDVFETHDVDMTSTLEPLVGASAEASKPERKEQDASMMMLGTPSKKKTQGNGDRAGVWLWLPLTFPNVPKKGDWDVRRLKDSVYFFS
ncbi:DNA-directed RNA polymerase [Knufia fluminis]|uniref:DNA-directed RNA polymerase n=1 Tax=Knufia fluminis TaxID=191047 RepID=A0AAN8E9A8_9EURO|nr:DNA-directed RNA polymerase [Knufia fluminis]